jgi:gluconokinase
MLSHENRPAMVQSTPPTADHLPSAAAPNRSSQHQHHHLFIVTGPAGCGKSTVGQFIAKTMNLPFVEGDEVRLLPLHASHNPS